MFGAAMLGGLLLSWWQRLRIESHFLGGGLVEAGCGGIQGTALASAAEVPSGIPARPATAEADNTR